jgi:hypothetical protein
MASWMRHPGYRYQPAAMAVMESATSNAISIRRRDGRPVVVPDVTPQA